MGSLTPGTIIGGRYRVTASTRLLDGRAAYAATHLDTGEDVVVRLLGDRVDPSDESSIKAFRRELRVVVKLRHPTIETVIDFGQTESAEPFVVLVPFRGESLRDRLAQQPLSERQTVELLKNVASGLHYLQQFGLFHLCATPERIAIDDRYAGTSCELVDLIDCVWHDIVGGEREPDVRVAAPEVLNGESPSAASEVYAIGHLAVACLTGKLLLHDLSPAEAVEAHLSGALPPIPETDGVSTSLIAVVERCIAAQPRDRYVDCAELMGALDSYEDSAEETLRLKAVRPSSEGFFPVRGTVFAGKFEVEAILGSGGFARVFKAADIESGRKLALKVLRPDKRSNESDAKRFVREGKLVFSFLSNPHTISVFDYGETENGLLYIAFEYIDGHGLDAVVEEQGAMSATRVIRILEQCLTSLAEAHGMGVLHRDIKPANIMLSTRNGVEDWVTVLDFGVAKIASDLMETAELTVTGASVGTPRYMAPEQISGETVGPESDIYSLGLVMYELLTGQRAVQGKSTIDIIATQLDPQSAILPRTAQLPTAFALVVNKMMRKDRASRYQAAHEVLTELRKLERGVTDEATIDTGTR